MHGRDAILAAEEPRLTAPEWLRSQPLGTGVAAGVAATGVLLALAPRVGVALAVLGIAAALRRWPGAVLAVSWNGFWLYLAALDLLDVTPRTRTTAVAYVVIALLLAAFAWQRRDRIERRLAEAPRLTRTWVVVAALLGLWFALNVALLSHGTLPHRVLGVFALATVPTVVAVAGAGPRDLLQARAGLVLLGLVFVAIECVAARNGAPASGRFSPIAHLDPISAALVPTVAALAAATYRFTRLRGTLLQAVALLALAGGAALNGARGPLVALVLALAVTAALSLRLRGVLAVAATCLGLLAGSLSVETVFSQPAAISSLVTESTTINETSTETGEISSLSIRKQWLEKALRAIPQKPLLGHGVGSLVDDTPEAKRMGVAGQRVYPHNDFVESAYSLGALGFVLFVPLVLLPVVALWRRRSLLRHPHAAFAVALFSFALFESNFSGEIGTDLLLWSGALLALLVFEARPAPDARDA